MRALTARPLAPALAVLAGTVLAACEPQARPIVYGEDTCGHCRMGIVDEQYGAELVTRTGKVHTFDSVECLAGFYLGGQVPREEVHSLWVTDFQDPPTLIPVEEAFFLHSRDLPSPMGMNLTAFSHAIRRDAVTNSFFGELLDWEGVLALVEESGARPHGEPGGSQGGAGADHGQVSGHGVGSSHAGHAESGG